MYMHSNHQSPPVQSITTSYTLSQVTGNLKYSSFTAPAGVSDFCVYQLQDYLPIHFHTLFVDDEIII